MMRPIIHHLNPLIVKAEASARSAGLALAPTARVSIVAGESSIGFLKLPQ
jgi:hypothetical protein